MRVARKINVIKLTYLKRGTEYTSLIKGTIKFARGKQTRLFSNLFLPVFPIRGVIFPSFTGSKEVLRFDGRKDGKQS